MLAMQCLCPNGSARPMNALPGRYEWPRKEVDLHLRRLRCLPLAFRTCCLGCSETKATNRCVRERKDLNGRQTLEVSLIIMCACHRTLLFHVLVKYSYLFLELNSHFLISLSLMSLLLITAPHFDSVPPCRGVPHQARRRRAPFKPFAPIRTLRASHRTSPRLCHFARSPFVASLAAGPAPSFGRAAFDRLQPAARRPHSPAVLGPGPAVGPGGDGEPTTATRRWRDGS